MDLKNVKSWQIAATSLIINIVLLAISSSIAHVDTACEFGCGMGVFLMQVVFSVIILVISISVLLLIGKNETLRKIGAVASIIFGFLFMFLIGGIIYSGQLDDYWSISSHPEKSAYPLPSTPPVELKIIFIFRAILFALPEILLFIAGIYYFKKEAIEEQNSRNKTK